MENVKNAFRKFISLKWYYQLAIALTSLVIATLLVRFLLWSIPIIGGILVLLFVATEGEIFSNIWERYKQSKQIPTNPFFTNVYHWLTEEGVSELPIVTLQFLQGVEFPDINQGIYYIHLNKMISNDDLLDFKTKVCQAVKYLSNGHTDAIVSKVRREPFLAIKIRLVSSDEVTTKKRQVEEDF